MKRRSTPRRSAEDAYLSDYVDIYLHEVAALSAPRLRERQPPPFGSVNYGCAGLAYMFLRAFRAGRGRWCLDEAERWSRAAWRMRDRADAYVGPNVDPPPVSIAAGRAGLAYVGARIAAARSRAGVRDLRVRELLALVEAPGASPTFMEGLSGAALALLGVLADGDDERVRSAGDRIAQALLAHAIAATRAPPVFAFGELGVHHAVLRWSLATGFDVPPALFVAFDRLDVASLADRQLRHTWCNGTIGLAIVLARMAERSGLAHYASAARDALAATPLSPVGNLCCGLAGRAYAVLAVDRSRTARRRARELAIAAITAEGVGHPNSLLRGHPGIVCLALDLLGAGEARFPLVDD